MSIPVFRPRSYLDYLIPLDRQRKLDALAQRQMREPTTDSKIDPILQQRQFELEDRAMARQERANQLAYLQRRMGNVRGAFSTGTSLPSPEILELNVPGVINPNVSQGTGTFEGVKSEVPDDSIAGEKLRTLQLMRQHFQGERSPSEKEQFQKELSDTEYQRKLDFQDYVDNRDDLKLRDERDFKEKILDKKLKHDTEMAKAVEADKNERIRRKLMQQEKQLIREISLHQMRQEKLHGDDYDPSVDETLLEYKRMVNQLRRDQKSYE